MSDTEIPRRIDILRNIPAELSIRHALDLTERLGCDVKLTDASVKLGEALDLVSDYVDEQKEQIDPELAERILRQCLTDFEGIENEILSTPEKPAQFAEWTTVANTMRWIKKSLGIEL